MMHECIPGDSLLCMDAPWHEPDNVCTIRYYGPRPNEVVTIEKLLYREDGIVYFNFKEYPIDPNDPKKDAGYRFIHFERMLTDKSLYEALNIKINDDSRIS